MTARVPAAGSARSRSRLNRQPIARAESPPAASFGLELAQCCQANAVNPAGGEPLVAAPVAVAPNAVAWVGSDPLVRLDTGEPPARNAAAAIAAPSALRDHEAPPSLPSAEVRTAWSCESAAAVPGAEPEGLEIDAWPASGATAEGSAAIANEASPAGMQASTAGDARDRNGTPGETGMPTTAGEAEGQSCPGPEPEVAGPAACSPAEPRGGAACGEVPDAAGLQTNRWPAPPMPAAVADALSGGTLAALADSAVNFESTLIASVALAEQKLPGQVDLAARPGNGASASPPMVLPTGTWTAGRVQPVTRPHASRAWADAAGGGQDPFVTWGDGLMEAVSRWRKTDGRVVEITVKPDDATEIALRLERSGGQSQIQAELRCGDGLRLQTQWPELQARLAQRGVTLGTLTVAADARGGSTEDGDTPRGPNHARTSAAADSSPARGRRRRAPGGGTARAAGRGNDREWWA